MNNTANRGSSAAFGGTRRTRESLLRALPWVAVAISAGLYAAHFFLGGGRSHLILDSLAYLQVSNGEQSSVPFSTRVLTPLFASLIASATGLSTSGAFKLLTPAALLTSVLLLVGIIRRRGGSPEWQFAVLLAFGSSLGVTFGYTPVMVDPLLLLLTCLTVIALDKGRFTAAVVFASFAALTKEYGLILGLVSSVYAYRRGHRKLAYLATLLPAIALVATTLAATGSSGVGFLDWQSFVSAMFGYHTSLFRFRGASQYPKLLYMWSWSALWPVLVIALGVVVSRLRNRIEMRNHEVGFFLMVFAIPFLLLGDWGRTLLIIVPLACAVGTSHPLARNPRFTLLLAIGGLSTALARPFHSETPPPHFLFLAMTAISVVLSLLISVIVVRFPHSRRAPKLDSGLSGPASEVVAQ